MSAQDLPRVCGECVEFHDTPVYDSPKATPWTCNPRGTRWQLMLKPTQKACRSVYARKRDAVRRPKGGPM